MGRFRQVFGSDGGAISPTCFSPEKTKIWTGKEKEIMLKIILSGCCGRMGQVVSSLVADSEDMEIVCGVDLTAPENSPYPICPDPASYFGDVDVLLDFSSPAALDGLLTYCADRQLPLVLCATGYNEEQLRKIEAAAQDIPIFRSGNMSLGINLIVDLIGRAIAVLGDGYDVEIVERHHNRKVDAPSGTALMLAEAAQAALPYRAEYVYDRSQTCHPRGKNEIGISAIRGGTIVGEHEIIFAGHDEVIEIKHSIQSREVFAAGALRACRFMGAQGRPGLYNMTDVIKNT